MILFIPGSVEEEHGDDAGEDPQQHIQLSVWLLCRWFSDLNLEGRMTYPTLKKIYTA